MSLSPRALFFRHVSLTGYMERDSCAYRGTDMEYAPLSKSVESHWIADVAVCQIVGKNSAGDAVQPDIFSLADRHDIIAMAEKFIADEQGFSQCDSARRCACPGAKTCWSCDIGCLDCSSAVLPSCHLGCVIRMAVCAVIITAACTVAGVDLDCDTVGICITCWCKAWRGSRT